MLSMVRRDFLKRTLALAPAALFPGAARAAPLPLSGLVLPSIDGGDYRLGDWAGRPILVVNTASLCAFTPQLEGLQALWEAYRDDGLVVLAVPSDSFRQELASDAEVAEFCTLTYGIDLPMTTILPVAGAEAHPLYRLLAAEGVRPAWNFHKVLIGRDGRVAADWPSGVAPMAPAIRRAVEAELGL